MSTLRHINKLDMVRLDENTVVVYSDKEHKWVRATTELESLYDNQVTINVKTEKEMLTIKVSNDSVIDVMDKKLAKVKLDAVVMCVDENTNTWAIVESEDYYHKLFTMFENNLGRMNAESFAAKNPR